MACRECGRAVGVLQVDGRDGSGLPGGRSLKGFGVGADGFRLSGPAGWFEEPSREGAAEGRRGQLAVRGAAITPDYTRLHCRIR